MTKPALWLSKKETKTDTEFENIQDHLEYALQNATIEVLNSSLAYATFHLDPSVKNYDLAIKVSELIWAHCENIVYAERNYFDRVYIVFTLVTAMAYACKRQLAKAKGLLKHLKSVASSYDENPNYKYSLIFVREKNDRSADDDFGDSMMDFIERTFREETDKNPCDEMKRLLDTWVLMNL